MKTPRKNGNTKKTKNPIKLGRRKSKATATSCVEYFLTRRCKWISLCPGADKTRLSRLLYSVKKNWKRFQSLLSWHFLRNTVHIETFDFDVTICVVPGKLRGKCETFINFSPYWYNQVFMRKTKLAMHDKLYF